MQLQVGLLWHGFGRPNLGVDALSRSNLHIMRQAAKRAGCELLFVLLSRPYDELPPSTDVMQGPYFRLRGLLDGTAGLFWRALKSCDLIVDISVGDGFSTIYGRLLFALQVTTKALALGSGRPLVLAPQTIGPYSGILSTEMARRIIDRSVRVFSRDGQSAKVVQSFGGRAKSHEVIDVAFKLPFQSEPRRLGQRPRVGVNVSGLLYFHGDRFGLATDYASYIRGVVRGLLEAGAEVWLLAHVIGGVDATQSDDLAVSHLALEFPEVRSAPLFNDSVEAKGFIGGMDFFTGARMHACIAAISSGTPVMPFAYSRKFNGLFDSLNYSRYVDGLASSTEEAITTTLDAFSERVALKIDVQKSMEIAAEGLARYEDEMVNVLSMLLARKLSAN